MSEVQNGDHVDRFGRYLREYLAIQQKWSAKTFGPGRRTLGIISHIQKELEEILQNPLDLSEWIDVIILALDGYWRHGGTPDHIMRDLIAKQDKNLKREWPEPQSEDVAVEHVRSAGEPQKTSPVFHDWMQSLALSGAPWQQSHVDHIREHIAKIERLAIEWVARAQRGEFIRLLESGDPELLDALAQAEHRGSYRPLASGSNRRS